MRAIWENDPAGMSDLLPLDEQWREAFEAEEELVRRLRSIPPAEHARLTAALAQGLAQGEVQDHHGDAQGGHGAQAKGARVAQNAYETLGSKYGITDEAFERAIGPAEYTDRLSDEKYGQRWDEIYLRFEMSEEGYAVKLALEALVARHPEILEGWRKVRIPRNSDE